MRLLLPRSLKAATARAAQRLRAIASSVGHAFSRRSRWARRTALVLVTLLGVLIVFNLALNLGISRPFLTSLISVNPQSFRVHYRRAWSFWPTIVYLRNVEVRGNDANVQWQVQVDRARVSMDLAALFEREFRATKVRAHGIGVRVRRKIQARAATSDRLAALPPISGFAGPPLLEAGPPPPGIPDEKYDLWSVRIENVDGRARQIWVDEFHFEGDAHVTGAFFVRPKRRVWVGPASATFVSGSVVIGNEKLLDRTSGSVHCTIPPFDPRPPVGMEVFRFVSGTVRFDADIPSARALDYYTRIRGSSTAFDGGKGVFHLDGTLRSGVVRPMKVSLMMGETRVENETWIALGSLHLSAKTEAVGRSAWVARIAPIELSRAGAKSPVLRGKELRITASADEIDLSKPAPDVEVRAELPSGQVPNLQIVNTLLSSTSPLHVDGGNAWFSAHLDTNTATNWATGVLVVGAYGIHAHYGGLRFRGRIDASAHVARVLLDSGDLDVSRAIIDVRDVTLRDSNAVVSNWWSRIEAREATLRPAQRVPLAANWTAKLQNATPVLAFSQRVPSIPGWITRFLTGGEVEASGRLRAGKSFVELSNLEAQTGILSVEGSFRQRGEASSGAFGVSAGPLSVGIELKGQETKLIFIGTPVAPELEAPRRTPARR